MFRRAETFWIQNNETRKQETLQTKDRDEALRLLAAKNEAHRQPIINMQIARAYLMVGDPKAATRTWAFVMDAGTGAPCGERGRAAMVFADRGALGAKRAAENAASQREWQVVEAITGRLPAGLCVAGLNCAAVEKSTESRADSTLHRASSCMKTHPSTAVFRMKRKISIAVGSVLFILGTVVQSQAQNLVQSLNVRLTAYDTVGNQTIRIGTKELIQYFVGTNVPNGHLYLVTPMGNVPGTTGDLNAFLRITSGATTVLEISRPDQFNLFQDSAALKTSGMKISSHALNRFSINSGSVRAELQGISTWNISQGLVNGVDVSGSGSFQSNVNGWISIYNVTQPVVPVSGSIVASSPKPGS